MPIYEYQCNQCTAKFEMLIRGNNQEKIVCPYCKTTRINRLISRFAHFSGNTQGNITPSSSCSSCASHNCSTCGR
ncbi:MAG: zinc ribbon domain-containing protein [Candidatus Omnitrophota bacterium]